MAAILAVGFLTACGAGRNRSTFGRSQEEPVRMEVTNNNFLKVTVYAYSGSNQYRLGDVGGKGSARFTIDPGRISIDQGIQFRVAPVGSNRRYVSPAVFVDRGSWVMLTVGAELGLSYVTVR